MSEQSFELLCFMVSKKIVFQLVCELWIENFNRRLETRKDFGVIRVEAVDQECFVWILEVRSKEHRLTIF